MADYKLPPEFDALLSALVAMGREGVTPILAGGRYINDAAWGEADASDAMDWARDYLEPLSREMGRGGKEFTTDLLEEVSRVYNAGGFGAKAVAESPQIAALADVWASVPEDVKAGSEMITGGAATLAPFLRAPQAIKQVRNAAMVRRFDDAYTPDESLGVNNTAIQDEFADILREDVRGALSDYDNLAGSLDGKITSVDEMRELNDAYRSNRGLSKAVHEPASALSKLHWQDTLKSLNKGDSVMLMSGGTGAGKTSSIIDAGISLDRYDAVFDSNLQSFDKATAKIDEALKKGLDVEVIHVYRDPMTSFSGPGSALSRAMRLQDTPSGMKPGGRTVPIDAHIGTHQGANQTVKQLESYYADNPNVNIRVVDNTGGKGQSTPANTGIIPDDLGSGVDKEALHETLYRAYLEGDIDRRTLEGFISR